MWALQSFSDTQTCTLNHAIKSETWAHTRRPLPLLHTYTLTCNMALRPTPPAAHVHMSGWVACNCKHPLHPCPDPSMGWACTFHKHKHTHEVDTVACTICVGVGQYRVFTGKRGIWLSADLYLKVVCSFKSSNITLLCSVFIVNDNFKYVQWNKAK